LIARVRAFLSAMMERVTPRQRVEHRAVRVLLHDGDDMQRLLIIGSVLALTCGCGGGGGGSGAPAFGSGTTPVATPSPSPAPGGPLTLSSTSVAFSAAGQTATVTASEPAYAGPIAPDASGCAAVAGLTPGSVTAAPATFTVTAQGSGACSIAFTDGFGQRAVLAVGVTLTQGSIK
jgi:hypothetical protein